MEQLNVKSQRELALELTRLGSSLDDARQSFNENVIASQWIRSKIKVNDDVSPDEMVKYYHDHRKEFEYRAKVRWEELTVRKSGIPAQAAEAYAKLAQMGNEVWPRVGASRPDTPIFGDVAKSKSEGFNANDGGLYDWTRQGTLKAEVVDQSLFSLPVGQMSTILDSGTAFHIVRVLERAEAGCRPFSEVQNDIRDKLKDERMAAAQKKYLSELRKNAKIWTVYSGNVSVAALMDEMSGGNQKR